MPQSGRKGILHAITQPVISKNSLFKDICSRMAKSLLRDSSDELSISRGNKSTRAQVTLRETRLIPDRGECHGSTIMRDKRFSNNLNRWPTGGNTLHPKHTVRRGVIGRLRGTFLQRFNVFRSWFVQPSSQTEQWSSRPILAKASSGFGAATRIRGHRSNSASNRFLNKASSNKPFFLQAAIATFALLTLTALMPTDTANAAASLVIKPTRVIVTEGTPVVAVTIENQGTTEAVVQLQLMSWTQENGEDIYGPTDTLGIMVCPSMSTIQPGESQILRVALEEVDRDWSTEGSFRLFIQEIPSAPSEEATAVQVAVRIGVPVFLPPKKIAQPPLAWQLESRGEDGLWMTVSNSGNVHALISNLQLTSEAGFQFQAASHQYVLPGSTVTWRLDQLNPISGTLPEAVQLLVSTDQGTYQETLSIKK